MNIWVVEAGQFELILYTTCATGSARAVFYGVLKEHGQSPWFHISPLADWPRSTMRGRLLLEGCTSVEDFAAQRRRRLAVGASPRRCFANDQSRVAATSAWY